VLVTFYVGDVAQGRKLIEPLRRFGDPHGEHIGVQPYAQWQKAFDPLLMPGARNYWKSHNFTKLSDGALNSMIEFAGKLPSPQCEIFLASIAGTANRVAPPWHIVIGTQSSYSTCMGDGTRGQTTNAVSLGHGRFSKPLPHTPPTVPM
jgi:hypothetical protein